MDFPTPLAVNLITIIQLVVGVVLIGGFLWLVVRLLARMTRFAGKSPPGHKPADRIDDEDREIF